MKWIVMVLDCLIVVRCWVLCIFIWFLLWEIVIGIFEFVILLKNSDGDFCILIKLKCVLKWFDLLCIKCGYSLVFGIKLCRLDSIW